MLCIADLINWTQLEINLVCVCVYVCVCVCVCVCVFKDEQLTFYGLEVVFSVLFLLSNHSRALHTLS